MLHQSKWKEAEQYRVESQDYDHNIYIYEGKKYVLLRYNSDYPLNPNGIPDDAILIYE